MATALSLSFNEISPTPSTIRRRGCALKFAVFFTTFLHVVVVFPQLDIFFHVTLQFQKNGFPEITCKARTPTGWMPAICHIWVDASHVLHERCQLPRIPYLWCSIQAVGQCLCTFMFFPNGFLFTRHVVLPVFNYSFCLLWITKTIFRIPVFSSHLGHSGGYKPSIGESPRVLHL